MDQPTLNNAAVAGFYSQLAGLLAGFAFAGLLLVLTKAWEDGQVEDRFGPPLKLMLCSFLGLVLTSLTYAVIAGDDSTRSSSTHVVAGAAFAASALMLLLALDGLLALLLPAITSFVTLVTVTLAPLVAVVYLAAGVLEVAALEDSGVLAVVCAIGVILVGAASILRWSE